MILLAVEGSGTSASIAVVDNEKLLGSITVDYDRAHSETLLPIMEALLEQLEIKLNNIGAIAVANGPGSFTGLRIASSTVKALARALNIPIVPVSTLKGFAYNYSYYNAYIVPMLDARANQVYTAVYKVEKGFFSEIITDEAVPVVNIISRINELEDDKIPVIICGNGAYRYADTIEDECKKNYLIMPSQLNTQSAIGIARLGMEELLKNNTTDYLSLSPSYLRKSQAERQRENKQSI